MSQINIGWVQNTSFFIYVCVVCMCEERKKGGRKRVCGVCVVVFYSVTMMLMVYLFLDGRVYVWMNEWIDLLVAN